MKFGEAMRMAKGEDWIKPRYHKYITGERDIEGEQRHAKHLLAIPNRDRTKSWSASAAGTCLRARQFAYLGLPGKPPDEHAMEIFLNGTWVHLRHQVVGLTAGYLVAAEVPLINTDLNLRGTMDAIDLTGSVVEYKSINQNGFGTVRQFGPKDEHKLQVHSYMLAGDFEQARIIYENKNTNDIKEFLVPRDENLILDVRSDLEELNLATENGTLLPILPECHRKEGRYRWCPFASQCLEIRGFQEVLEKSAIPATSSSEAD